ncbi:Uu.00g124160.m01.CDS01 [Anthostomella pinea]|uniref:Uu.00g124160.m01.CDS01 n=1 Tax=Anthostomella pinea TaxID=933095 RepID=A0AAI8VHK0_9PEZI|nr:Uu.00g124160.m01.CDS01 [Anthostomella pinea]
MEASLAITATAVGVICHVLFFNRGEHHLHGMQYVLSFGTAVVALSCAPFVIGEKAPFTSSQVLSAAACYIGGIFLSLLVYRQWLHPLNKFPGPSAAKLTSLWFSTQLGKGDAHTKVLELHEKYGDFVRIGSSDLSIVHPDGVTAVYGTASGCDLGAWYDLSVPMLSLQSTRDKNLHRQYRRIWSDAFSDNAVRGYEERTKSYRARLISHLSQSVSQEQPVDMTLWFNFYTFDVMGDLAFGRSFDMLATSQQHWAISILHAGLRAFSIHAPVWFFRFFMAIPGLGGDFQRYVSFCCDTLDKRIKTKVDTPDIMSTLLKPWEGAPMPKRGLKLLQGDSRLLIVAGSDTTGATLTHALYELVKHPEHIEKIRNELAPFMTDGQVDFQKIQSLPHLNCVIDETLRLHPPVPTALPRRTPSEGITVGEVHVPGDMTVWCSQYAIGRTESLYEQANSFIPERWSSRPEMVADKRVFAPFSHGTDPIFTSYPLNISQN